MVCTAHGIFYLRFLTLRYETSFFQSLAQFSCCYRCGDVLSHGRPQAMGALLDQRQTRDG